MSVLPSTEGPRRKRRWIAAFLVLLVLAAAVGYVVYSRFFYTVPQQFMSQEERFKYGSVGIEEELGIPYWIWAVLPRVFPEYLPGSGGYASLGMVWEDGQELPVGFSKKRIGYERVAFNCAICHTGTYRVLRTDGRTSNTVIVPGAPANRFDPQAYLAFLRGCAQDPRFNSDTLMEAIEYNVDLSWLDEQIYRRVLIPGTRKALQKQTQENAWMTVRPLWGRGRIDPFNPVKFGMLEMDPAKDETVGNSDMMPLWEIDRRQSQQGYHLHWDGLVTNLVDCSLAGALGDGASPESLPVEEVEELVEWLGDYHPTTVPGSVPTDASQTDLMKYPLGYDASLARDGAAIFAEHCGNCHSSEGDKYNQVVRWSSTESDDTISTDPNRLVMWNPPPRDPPAPFQRYREFADGYPWDLNSFVPTTGYVSVPLNGIWLRAPYLHNGSVPTLEDLLQPPMEDQQVVETLDRVRPGTYQRLEQRLRTAEPRSAPIEQLQTELDRLKPVVDGVIKLARLKGRRPPLFYRGYDVLDPARVGFVHDSRAVEGRTLAIPYATFIQGNSNRGHLYGVDLSAADKLSLVEYLKTL